MRTITATLVLLAAVATVLVGVRQQSANVELEYRVWDEMRRRDALAKQIRELQTAMDELLAPRRLLEEEDVRLGLVPPVAPEVPPGATTDERADVARGPR